MDDFSQDVAKKIKELRIQQDLTLKDVADRIGMSTRNYQRIEYGQLKIDLKKLVLLAKVLNFSVAALLQDFFEYTDPLNKEITEAYHQHLADYQIMLNNNNAYNKDIQHFLDSVYLYQYNFNRLHQNYRYALSKLSNTDKKLFNEVDNEFEHLEKLTNILRDYKKKINEIYESRFKENS